MHKPNLLTDLSTAAKNLKNLASLAISGGADLPKKTVRCIHCGKEFTTYAAAPTTFSDLPKANTTAELQPIVHCGSNACWQKEHLRQDAHFNQIMAVEKARKERDAKSKQGKTKPGSNAATGAAGRPEASSLFPDSEPGVGQNPGAMERQEPSPALLPDDPF